MFNYGLTISRTHLTIPLGLCAATFLLSWAVIAKVLPGEFRGVRYWYTPEFEKPSSDYFYADAWDVEASHAVLYHDIGESIENARKADILFIGNSRMPLGLREQVIKPLADAAGVSVFSLAMGHAEGAEFARRIIHKHKLKPKVLVAVGGSHFYSFTGMSALAKDTMSISRWKAITQYIQTQLLWPIRSRLHALVPRITLPGVRGDAGYLIYRSKKTGWWHPVVERSARYDVPYRDTNSKFEHMLAYANQLNTEMSEQGMLLVATAVPYPRSSNQHLDALKSKLGITTVNLTLDGMQTADGSHLHKESAVRFSHAFWQEFISLPEVRQRLGQTAN